MKRALWTLLIAAGSAFPAKIPVEVSEFVFEKAPFASAHASTILSLPNGDILSAWFGGSGESHKGTGIWIARKPAGGKWTAPEPVTDLPQTACWNPVLYRDSKGAIRLFYKVGPDERAWVGASRVSKDNGKTWGPVSYLPAGLYGPIRVKPIYLANGTLLAPTSVEAGMLRADKVEQPFWAWTAWMEISKNDGDTWQRFGPILFPGKNYGLIQPTVWETKPDHLVALFRSTEPIGAICKATSKDGGKTWTPATATQLPNPDSGIDTVKLKDGRVALIYNHTKQGRTPLNLAFSRDNAETWGTPYVLEDEPGEFSYPAMIQTPDGKLHMTYTWNRKKIKYAVVDPAKLSSK